MRRSGLLASLWLVALVVSGCLGESLVGAPPGDGGGMDAFLDGSDTGTGCPAGQVACGGRCTTLAVDPANCGACGTACGAGMVCVAGGCQVQCPVGQSVCGGQCVTLQTDVAHCGACDTACPSGQVCSLGRCATSCDATLATCGGGGDGGAALYCADARTDRLNCGACGNACAAGEICVARACQLSCPTGQSACGAACRDLLTDDAHCGRCDRACPPGNACTAGECVASCSAGLTVCSGVCTNLQTDNASCGACGTACPAGQVCSGGACGTTCAPPLATCTTSGATSCADTAIDPTNCGDCATTCTLANTATAGCTAGACAVVRCAATYGDCDGVAANGCETSTLTNPMHCGSCGRACALPHATSGCAVGTCVVMACAAGYADCNADPSDGCEVNTATDRGHCGTCATACGAGQVCSAGVCGATCGAPLATCGAAGAAFCADTAVDPLHCGACDVACALDHVATHGCAARACTVGTCAAGYGDCDGLAPNGCETDTRTTPSHCGGCGRVCALPNATATCTAGACVVGTCAVGYADCNGNPSDGCEVNTRTDNGSCGACGTACAAGQVCSGGACGATCGGGLTTCGMSPSTFCANTDVDPARCGSCTTSCALAGTALTGCTAGACTVARCNAGAGDCNGDAADGCETNTQSSTAHCGACGRSCALPHAAATCAGGACALGACAAGYADCDGVAANGCEVHTASDNTSCGACGIVCAAGRVCAAGVCATTCGSTLTTCDGTCADTAVDPARCGGCTTACALPNVSVQACVRGACVVGGCAPGSGDCDGAAANGCETLTRGNDALNCGGCGVRCAFANAGATCLAGVCTLGTCATGFGDCDGVAANGCETNLTTDRAHCGACSVTGASRACASGQVCSAGACGASCGSGTVNCGGDCVRTATNVDHCGGCGQGCALPRVSVQACASGGCVVGGCAAGFGDCDGTAANGCETATRGSDVANCGGCGLRCAYANAGATCASGTCALAACQPGYADCDGVAANGCETDLRTDRAHCGACSTAGASRACAGGQVCSAGMCAASCGTGTSNCGGDCVRTTTDVAHCGGCDRVCALPSVSVQACAASRCVVGGCAANRGDCNGTADDGCETDAATNTAHCGGCGRVCALPHVTTQTCAAGACTIATGACAVGWADCNGLASDGCEVNLRGTDGGNCGACGMTCPAGRVCGGGVCGTTCGAGLTTCGSGMTAFCANTAVDPTHCGSCNAACALPGVAVEGCASSACTVVTCDPDRGNCNGTASDGCETNTLTNIAHCGGCGRACALPHVATSSCAAGACAIVTCTDGWADCNGTASDGCEVNLRGTDGGNCGACGMTCPAGRVCGGGVCGTTCGGGLTTCGSGMTAFCANTAVDPAHCGDCNTACSLPGVAVEGCASSACTVVTCDPDRGNCNGTASDGCETSTLTTVAHCGGCGRACALPHVTTQSCSAGLCRVAAGSCEMGWADCNGTASDGCEVNLRGTDGANCGGCGTTCELGRVCTGGACSATCGTGLTTCGSGLTAFCANTSVDPAHCGSCTTACALPGVAVEGCVASACTVVTCNPNVGDCNGTSADGCETNLTTSTAHCGGCGRACALPHVATQTCSVGACIVAPLACAAGYADCNGLASDGCEAALATDSGNCGACAAAAPTHVCGSGQVCSGGVCGASCGGTLTTCGAAPSSFCANTAVDPSNCGVCGRACALANVSAPVCAGSACAVTGCNAGYANCDGLAPNGCEVDTAGTVGHCGACGRICSTNHVTAACAGGVCNGACASGFADCNGNRQSDGCEVGTSTDVSHCGACGVVCSSNHVTAACAGGVCNGACAAGYADCNGNRQSDGCEVRTANDPDHCGGCTMACSTNHLTPSCAASACNGTCDAGFADCNGDRRTDGCEAAIGGSCTSGGLGACQRAGVFVCSGGGTACNAAAGSPTAETCDNVDNDCDGVIDNGVTRSCYTGAMGTNGVGACHGGAQTCAAGSWGASCAGQVVPGTETCNNVDDDCDSAVDEAPAESSCPVVTNASRTCSAGTCGFTCDAGYDRVGGACVAEVPPRPLAPISLGDVTQRRPTLRWALAAGSDGAVVELCRDRACTMVIETLTVTGSSARPSADLPASSVVFWRMRGRVGTATGTAYSPTWLFHVPAVSASTGVDTSFNPHFDIDGDGYDDLVVGAPSASPGGRSQAGSASVFHGSATWTQPPAGTARTPDRLLEGGAANDNFGISVASAGDVNGDGYADLVVGAYLADPGGRGNAGTASVFHGSATWTQPPAGTARTPDRLLEGGAAGDLFGLSVASAGDVNGDGYADLIVGTNASNRAYVFFGGSSPSAMPSLYLTGSSGFGVSVASAGDVNGDGYADLIVGAYNSNTAYVYFGGSTPSAVPTLSLTGPSGSSGFGWSVASAGDVNGDGYADLIVGANNSNTAYVYVGGSTPSAVPSLTLRGPIGSSGFGYSVASAADVHGDGGRAPVAPYAQPPRRAAIPPASRRS